MKKLLIITALLFCGIVSQAQIYLPISPVFYGEKANRIKALLSQHIPEKTSNVTNTTDTTAQIYLNKGDSSVWAYYKPRGFFKIGSGGGDSSLFLTLYRWINDSTVLRNLINGKLAIANNLSDLANVATARANLGGTTVGQALYTGTNPSSTTWIRVNADNSVSFRTAAQTLTDLGGLATGINFFKMPGSFDLGFPRINADNTITQRQVYPFLNDIGLQITTTTSGSANTYTMAWAYNGFSLSSGYSWDIKFNVGNTGASTLNIASIGAIALVKGASVALVSGDLITGKIYHIIYNGTSYEVTNPGSSPTGSESPVYSVSPNLTGSPTSPTQAQRDSSTKIATTAYADRSADSSARKTVMDSATTVVCVGCTRVFDPATNKLYIYIDSTVTQNVQTSSYNLSISDGKKKIVIMDVGSANFVNIPTNASVAFPIGTIITVRQQGAGQTTVTASGGVTLESAGARYKIAEQFGVIQLEKTATNTWSEYGNTAL